MSVLQQSVLSRQSLELRALFPCSMHERNCKVSRNFFYSVIFWAKAALDNRRLALKGTFAGKCDIRQMDGSTGSLSITLCYPGNVLYILKTLTEMS